MVSFKLRTSVDSDEYLHSNSFAPCICRDVWKGLTFVKGKKDYKGFKTFKDAMLWQAVRGGLLSGISSMTRVASPELVSDLNSPIFYPPPLLSLLFEYIGLVFGFRREHATVLHIDRTLVFQLLFADSIQSQVFAQFKLTT